ncbi:sodium:proton antiporter [Hyphobacterium sp. CCMP332]|nr:sodium:proton antiporter [Hyphobacterium sp. CCMP332]
MKGMTLIVKTVVRIMAGVIFIYGMYIILHGHLTPGGGFAGGAVIAGSLVLLVLAFGSDKLNLKLKEKGSAIFESLALLAFITLALIGFGIGMHVFFGNYLPKGEIGELISAGTIPLYNIAIGVEVAAALFTIFLALVIFKEEVKS